jgi:hypothetical protein
MQKAKTQEWKSKSRRNRHNGRVNFATQHIHKTGQQFAMSDGKKYCTFITKVMLPPTPNDNLTVGEDGVIEREKKFAIKSQTVRAKDE